jgi:hypothetical protein
MPRFVRFGTKAGTEVNRWSDFASYSEIDGVAPTEPARVQIIRNRLVIDRVETLRHRRKWPIKSSISPVNRGRSIRTAGIIAKLHNFFDVLDHLI